MKIEIGKTENVRRTITLTAEAAEVASMRKSAIDEVRKHVKVPGFRPGKAPDVLVLQRAKDTVSKELRSRLRDQALRHVNLFHGGGDILTVVRVEIPPVIGDGELIILVELDMRPEFELPDYNHIPLPVLPEPEVSEEEIDGQLRADMEKHAELESLHERRPLAEDDDLAKVAIVYLYPDDSRIFPDGEAAEFVNLSPRQAESFVVPEIARGVVGMTRFDSKEIPFTFSADFGVPDLTGKRAVAKCMLVDIFTRKIGTVEEFAQKMGLGNVQRLRDHVRLEVRLHKEFARRRQYQDAIVSFLCDSVDFPLPLSVLEQNAADMLGECVRRTGIRFSAEEMKTALLLRMEMGESALKRDFILGAIAKKEAIEITSDDLGSYLYSLAQAHELSPDALVRALKKDEDLLRKSRKECLMRKVLGLLQEWNLHGRPSANPSHAAPVPVEDDPHSMLVPKKKLQQASHDEGTPTVQPDLEPSNAELSAAPAKPSTVEPTACTGLLNIQSAIDAQPAADEKPTNTGAIACTGPMGSESAAHAEPSTLEPTTCARLLNAQPAVDAQPAADVKPTDTGAIACTGPVGSESTAHAEPPTVESPACTCDWSKKD
jgi:trigger factor